MNYRDLGLCMYCVCVCLRVCEREIEVVVWNIFFDVISLFVHQLVMVCLCSLVGSTKTVKKCYCYWYHTLSAMFLHAQAQAQTPTTLFTIGPPPLLIG
jgi:hypothetical protein